MVRINQRRKDRNFFKLKLAQYARKERGKQMSNLIKINNKDLQIKEFKKQRVITFKDIDAVHERTEGTARKNFNNNKRYFIEGVDYFVAKPSDVNNFPIQLNNAGTTLITESGYLMLVKSLTDDLAWKVQRELVNNYFRGKQLVNDLNNLSPQLQLLINMELRQNELETAITENKQEIQDMRDVIQLDTTSWRKDTTNLINKMAMVSGGYEHIKAIREESYKLLNERMGVSLGIRLTNKRRRMADEGASKSKRDKLNYLDIIAEDKKLIEGYVAIVKEMAIKYKVA